MCFIQTGALDGERNLKPKMAIKQVEDNLTEIITGNSLLVEVHCKQPPNASLHEFDAELKLVHADKQDPFIDLDLK